MHRSSRLMYAVYIWEQSFIVILEVEWKKSRASNTLKQTCWMVSFQSDYIKFMEILILETDGCKIKN